MKKRFVAGVLLLATLIFMLPMSVSATATSATFEVGDAEGTYGDTVTVPITISENPGITAFRLALSYPEDQLELVSVDFPKLLSSSATGTEISANPYLFSWVSMDSKDESAVGCIANLTFRILEDAPAGSAEITLFAGTYDVLNQNCETVPTVLTEGSVSICCTHTWDDFGIRCTRCKECKLLGFVQTRSGEEENTFDVRVLIEAEKQIFRNAEQIQMKMTFCDANGTSIRLIESQVTTAYTQVHANGDIYRPSAGRYIAGVAISSIPTSLSVAKLQLTVEVTQGETTVAYELGTATLSLPTTANTADVPAAAALREGNETSDSDLTAVAVTLDRDAIRKTIYAFLKKDLGLNDAAATGVLYNIYRECGFNPNDVYTESDGSNSYGICQWNKTRFQALCAYSEANGMDYTTLEAQLAYLRYELNTTEKKAYRMVKCVSNDAKGAYEAGYLWGRYFERCGSYENRAELSRTDYWPIYGKYAEVRLNVPFYSKQEGLSVVQACAASCVSYLNGYTANDSRVCDALNMAGNLSAIFVQMEMDFDAIFANLHQGIPMLLMAPNGDCYVVYGYAGSATEAEMGGFCLMMSGKNHSAYPENYRYLRDLSWNSEDWKLYTLSCPTSLLPICTDSADRLTICGFVSPTNIPVGNGFALRGQVRSSALITSVSAELTDADGKVISSATFAPSQKNFDLSALNQKIGFEQLSEGLYTLNLQIADASGETLSFSDEVEISNRPYNGKCSEVTVSPDPSELSGGATGIYQIKTSGGTGVNVRKEPSTSGKKLGAISDGTRVTVTEISDNGWGKIVYNDTEGWICLDYAQMISGDVFLISFEGMGGCEVPGAVLKILGTALTLPTDCPMRTGYLFLGWSDDVLSDTPKYFPGEIYTSETATTLYAVWRKLDVQSGDSSGDGLVDLRDLVILVQFLNGYRNEIDSVCADLNADGMISVEDAQLLQDCLNRVR